MLPFLLVGACIFVLLVPLMILVPPTGMVFTLAIYVAIVIATHKYVLHILHYAAITFCFRSIWSFYGATSLQV